MKIRPLIGILGLLFHAASIGTAGAVCPICTIAVGAGLGLSRWIGIDDTISGLWIGGLTVSLILWTESWFEKRQIRFPGRKTLTTIGYYALVVPPLFFMGLIGDPLNTLWGMDKLLLGTVIGSAAFLAGGLWYFRLKARHGGHAYFPFQKVVMPVSPLLLFSILFYFLTR